jgi:hypothetical protein
MCEWPRQLVGFVDFRGETFFDREGNMEEKRKRKRKDERVGKRDPLLESSFWLAHQGHEVPADKSGSNPPPAPEGAP